MGMKRMKDPGLFTKTRHKMATQIKTNFPISQSTQILAINKQISKKYIPWTVDL
jgi:hypothetical protein